MPYFRWTGIDSAGDYCSGKQISQSEKDLLHSLARKNITLASASLITLWYLRSTRLKIRSRIFSHLGLLLTANLRLSHALEIIASLLPTKKSALIVEDLLFCVESGLPLSKALSYYPQFFDRLTIATVEIGEASGSLAYACSSTAVHYEESHRLHKNIKDAIRAPLITFIFFLIIVLVLFIAVVPYFGAIIERSGKEVPAVTALLLYVSALLRSYSFWIGASIFVGVFYLIAKLAASFFNAIKEVALLSIPCVGDAMLNAELAIFLKSLHILLSQGVHLIQALVLAKETVRYHRMSWCIDRWIESIDEGKTFYCAIDTYSWQKLIELKAFVKIGEESGVLAVMIGKAGEIYQERAQKDITFLTALLQPLLLLVLGCLVAFLIFAIYMPLLALSDTF